MTYFGIYRKYTTCTHSSIFISVLGENLFFLCLVSHFAVARPIAGGAGQVLRAGQERTTAPHAAVPRLVSTRQLCKFLSLQVVLASSFPPLSLGHIFKAIYFCFFFFLSLPHRSKSVHVDLGQKCSGLKSTLSCYRYRINKGCKVPSLSINLSGFISIESI